MRWSTRSGPVAVHILDAHAGNSGLRMSVTVRAADLADAEEIARVHIASWQAAYRGQVADDVLNALDHEQRSALWRRILAPSQGDTLVALAEGGIVGFCHLQPSRDADASASEGEVTAIYVDPSWWHRGFGLKLMQRALLAATARAFAGVSLWVLRSNHGARAFYEAFGFQADGASKLEAIGGGPELELVRYRFSLQ